MDNLKTKARQAKRRLSSDFWKKCKDDVDATATEAALRGKNVDRVKSHLYGKVKSQIDGQTEDEFYLKVKSFLDEFGEVSDAIGRLTDREYYSKLSYEERQRYTLELSGKYLAALEKYRKEKESVI